MVEVIGAGMGRTGTYSLRLALEALGYRPCHHMSSLGEHEELIQKWEAAVRGEAVDWADLLTGFRAACDWPACSFWRELAEAFPKAKVVLTVRDPARWYASANRTIYHFMSRQPGLRGLVMRLEDAFYPSLARRRALAQRLIWQDTFGGRFGEPEHAMEVFRRHNEAVLAEIPADRLLVFDVREGWAPLCEFLGTAVPDHPFPHVNQAESFIRTAALRRRRVLTLRKVAPEEGSAIR
ncbi:sulfotransferase family protein [Nonomuraea sp. NPDC050790]|uniref:sulfotransferase family protein n=1 Tax=Nonomuraea sp. NPDC050790 TaxID=3364371 RepID=UPI0037B9736F